MHDSEDSKPGRLFLVREYVNVSGKKVEFEEKHIMEKTEFEVPGGGGVGGGGDVGKFPENHRVVR